MLRGRARILRSKRPQMVRQEIYGYLLTHYALIDRRCRAATEASTNPDRIKCTVPCASCTAASPTPRPFPSDGLSALTTSIHRSKDLNPQRRQRSYPRVVKRTRHSSRAQKILKDFSPGYREPEEHVMVIPR
ncbi:hypothetical protein ACFYPZ_29700 [Streptomyces sp. NPDC005506]|uniref:hypothetical protein n=1 Tax=unclassified Streptomyces TaxID=2593676 RepID=UPI003684C331